MRYRIPLLFLSVALVACSTGGVVQPDYTFAGSAIGDGKLLHCERVNIYPAEPSPVEEVVRTRCTSNEGGHLSKSGWDFLIALAPWLVRKIIP